MERTAPAVRVAAVLVALAVALLVIVEARSDSGLGELPERTEDAERAAPVSRDLRPYDGLGTWVDAFDYGPAYQSGDNAPAVTPDDVAAMADAGVRTIFLQANRDDERSPEGFVDRELVTEFLVEAHERDMAVVGWYLPTFRSVDTDLGHLQDLLEFESEGHRFDGVGVDIEYTEAVPNTRARNQRLLRLSERLREIAGAEPVSAIVLPPVLTEVVNPDFWPEFPWRELEPLYDAWLPMSYWTLREESSGYNDGATYHEESTRRMLANLGVDEAVVHGIGGIGDETTPDDLVAFVETLAEMGAAGGSIYDWATLSDANIALLDRLFADYPDVAG